jgi:hypothetical protein
MTTFLEPNEISELTDKVRRPSQIKVLNSMGIEHKVRPDGSVAILRAHITKVFGGAPDSARKTNKTVEPNWAAM